MSDNPFFPFDKKYFRELLNRPHPPWYEAYMRSEEERRSKVTKEYLKKAHHIINKWHPNIAWIKDET